MRILLDAMGGDNAPDANIKGAVKAINEISSEIVLVGNEKIINNRINYFKYENIQISIMLILSFGLLFL